MTRSSPSRTCSMCVMRMLGGEIGEGAVEPVVEPQLDLAPGDRALARRALRGPPLGLTYRTFARDQLAARLGHGQLRGPQRVRGAVVTVARGLEFRLGKPL